MNPEGDKLFAAAALSCVRGDASDEGKAVKAFVEWVEKTAPNDAGYLAVGDPAVSGFFLIAMRKVAGQPLYYTLIDPATANQDLHQNRNAEQTETNLVRS